ncbi:23S rRNA (guanosine(2251)-2'-O)-methyltransferase RlmB [Chromatocurvus halotolerans]|uniref:23S rRNA (guanosine-2'-O-)-methyltransferase RlmB n=1 Tax=Chromatocurvus halotolerans TaxID=1132028 RepID=A0A4R2KUC3_9GAMM|nr:23S rRNA (guanosine(2251)-2'-O)-methyltransferase RlmB [Chromatocurvus halotolerans]TCO74719.1 23S rRNA Gm-2251 2'-O-methyltransferase [Chromatocurvus halotolerans]
MSRVTYGIHAVDGLLRQRPGGIARLCVLKGREDRRVQALLTLAANQGVRVERLDKRALDAMAPGRHQGVAAELSAEVDRAPSTAQAWQEPDLLQVLDTAESPCLLLVLDGVTDPHNLGACLRSAEAAGAMAVVVPKDKSVGMTPTVQKVACGAAEVLPLVQVTNLARTLKALRERGVWVYGAAGEAAESLYDQDLRAPVALVLGSEGKGLRRLTREGCDALVQLPMAGSVSSLNVSVAAGVCLFEAVRQRRPTGTAGA